MFEKFYEFVNTPFSRTIPSKNLYKCNDSDELIERLKYTAQKQLFAVVIGDSGTGKTTTLRRFCDETLNDNYRTLYLSDSKMTPRTFYKSILEQLGFEAKYHRNEAKRQLHKEIEIMKGMNGILPVAIVDEAHLLSKEMLEEIRFLLNFKMDSQSPHDFRFAKTRPKTWRAGIFRSLMALILSGQTELWDKLKLQSYAAIRQRIDIPCILTRLDRSRTTEYITAQLAFAGTDKELFTEAAIDEVFKFSSGIPRLINKACSESLMFGAQNRKTILDDRMVKIVVEQELIGGVS